MTPAEEIEECLNQLYMPDGKAIWLRSPNPLMGGQIPNDLIARGEFEPVLRVLSMLCDGAYA